MGQEGRGKGDGLCFWFGGAHILHNLSNLCNCNTAMTTMTMAMVMVMVMAIEPPDDSDKQDSTVAQQEGEGGRGGISRRCRLHLGRCEMHPHYCMRLGCCCCSCSWTQSADNEAATF